jgi:hypothetical protein
LPPDYVLQTSADRYQCFYLFVEPADVAHAKAVAELIKQYALADSCTIDIAHDWRIAGTLNWPNAKKYGQGRPLEAQLVTIVKEAETRTSLAVLEAAIPLANVTPPTDPAFDMRLRRAQWALENGVPDAVEAWQNKEADDPADWDAFVASRTQSPGEDPPSAPPRPSEERVDTVYRMLPASVRDRIATVAPSADRSRIFAVIIGYFRRKHPDVPLDTIEAIFERFPDGPASK